MYKRCFFKYLFFFILFFVGGVSFAFSLNPSYLFLGNNRINTTNVSMVLLVTPSKSFTAGSTLTISFPDADDGKWCKTNDSNIPVVGVSSSIINIEGWTINTALPGTLTGRCYQGSGVRSYDRVVISGINTLISGISYGLQINPTSNLSTGPNVGSNNIILELQRGLERDTTAFAIYLKALDGVVVNAFVNEDTFSIVQVLDPVVEKGMWSRVQVRILDSKGNPISGRSIQLGLNLPSLTNWEIEQPAGLTNSNGIVQGRIRGFETNIVEVTAVDKSLSQDVFIQDSDWLTVTAVPTITLNQLPMYTPGLSRQITWNLLSGNYQYFLEASLNANFQTILKTSGWISANEYTFQNLENGKAYYYRGKVKNLANVESAFSNIVSSIQAENTSGTIKVLDPIVEKGIWSRVRVTVVDSQGDPMSNRRIILNIDRSGANWIIEQPINLTNSNGVTEGRIRGFEVGTVKVTAIDRTTSIDSHIEGLDWLQVVAVPTINLHTLPRYSPGLTRLITWNLLQGTHEYYIESSTSSNFATIQTSGWITLNQYLVQNLRHGQGYFYRGKVRNSAGVESSYSNVVSSIQDNEPPTIEEVDFEILAETKSNRVKFTFLIRDLSSVSLVEFECKDVDGNFFNCGNISSLDNFHYVTIYEEDLADFIISQEEYLLQYCVKAQDIVGNTGTFCGEKTFTFQEAELIEDEIIVEPEEKRNIVSRLFIPIQKNVKQNLETAVAYIQDLEIDDVRIATGSVAIVSTVVPVTILSVLFNPGNFYPVGQAFLGLMSIFKRKKRVLPYGYVYNSITKEPINRAIIRIYKGGKLVATAVTNVYGVFTANLEPGEYSIKVVVSGYSYPSKLITGNVDMPLRNIYRGGKFLVKEESHMQYSIPLDPIDSSNRKYAKTIFFNKFGNFFFSLQKIFVVVGLVIAFFLYLRTPDTFNLVIILFYIPILFIHLFLSFSSQKHIFGVVKDEQGNILQNLILGLREMEFERLVEKRITDAKGRYKFLVSGGQYQLEVLTPDYEIGNLKAKDLFFEGSVKKPLLVNKNLILEKKKKEQSTK